MCRWSATDDKNFFCHNDAMLAARKQHCYEPVRRSCQLFPVTRFVGEARQLLRQTDGEFKVVAFREARTNRKINGQTLALNDFEDPAGAASSLG